MQKHCDNCKKLFDKNPSISRKAWLKVRFCSRNCYGQFKVGKKPPEHEADCKCFRCTKNPWNKGLKDDPRSGKPWLGKKRTDVVGKMAEANRLRNKEKHFAWKGDAVSYAAMHHWLARHYKKTLVCEHCGKTGNSRQIQWANKTGNYLREDRNDWLELCASCHKLYDLG